MDDQTPPAGAEREDLLVVHNRQQLHEAMEALTEELLREYIETHLLSRGAPVGRA